MYSNKLDDVYYDNNNQKSREKILLEYMKAIDALTINDEYRLKKQILEYENKLKEVPRIEQLQTQLANRIIEEESIKQQIEKLRIEKELQAQTISSKYEKDIQAMKDQMNRLMSMIQQNPKLAQIKPGVLITKAG